MENAITPSQIDGDSEAQPARAWRDEPANDNAHERWLSGVVPAARFGWLDEVREDRWMLAWRALWSRFTSPYAPERAELAARATRRLVVRRGDARWPSVWLRVVAWSIARMRHGEVAALGAAAMGWLREQPAHPSWPLVWCLLKTHEAEIPGPCDGLDALLALRAPGRDARLPPPRISLKEASPVGVITLATLSDERLCAFVREWAEARFVRGVVIERRPDGYLVDVGVQIVAASRMSWLRSGDEIEVRVRSFESSDGIARVGEIRLPPHAIDDSVRVGDDEEAIVTGRYNLGLAVRFRGFCGFIEEAGIGGRDPRSFTLGERVRVTVLGIRPCSAVVALSANQRE